MAAVRSSGARHRRRLARRRRPGPADAICRARLAPRRLHLLRPLPPAARLPLTRDARAPSPLGPALALEYRSILVPIVRVTIARGGRARRSPRHRARRAHRPAARRRRTARAAARCRPDRAAREARTLLDEARDARRRTASAPSSASCARATRVARSSRRPSVARPRSSCSAPRADMHRHDLRPHRRLRAQARALPRDGAAGRKAA